MKITRLDSRRSYLGARICFGCCLERVGRVWGSEGWKEV